MRLALAAVVAAHAALHLLGAAKGLGWAQVGALTQPIGVRAGWAWLTAAVVVALAAALLAVGADLWWGVAAVAAVTSQAAILSAWQDAKVGTAVNVLLLVLAALGCAAHGPGSFDDQWQQRASTALAAPHEDVDVVREEDLAALPAPLAGYLRRTGVLGEPRPHSLYVTFTGRIRSGADQPWMPFTGRQVSTFGRSPTRLFLLHATRAGLPVTVLHVYDHGRATMRGKLLSLVPVLDASGPEMDRGETVTVFNDMAVLAPAALLSAPVVWEGLSDRRVRGTFTNGEQVVSATLHFNALHELVDFVSDDRLRASSDGTTFTPQTWSTPVERYGRFGGHWSAAVAVARWHAPAPEGAFTYVELAYDDIAHDPLTMLTPLRRRAGMAAVERPVHRPPAGSSRAPGRSSPHPRADGRGF